MQKLRHGIAAACLMAALTALAFAGVPGQGQEPQTPPNPPAEGGPPGGRPERGMNVDARLERLTHDLNLTAAQQEKIRPIFEKEAQRIKAVRANSSMTQGEARQKIRQIQRATRQQVSPILTPEQRQQWREERPGGGGGQKGGRGGPPPGGPQNPPDQTQP